MKLSDAMMLGSATCRMVGGDWNTCALGAAANAVGIRKAKTFSFFGGIRRIEAILEIWPWLGRSGKGGIWLVHIARKFDIDVCEGRMTLEQLVDYVKTIEPPCEECNEFTCQCENEHAEEKLEVECQVQRA